MIDLTDRGSELVEGVAGDSLWSRRTPRISSGTDSGDGPVLSTLGGEGGPAQSSGPGLEVVDTGSETDDGGELMPGAYESLQELRSVSVPRLSYDRLEDRLASFQRFYSEFVNATDLAESGFYYTGHMDQVQCFSCAIRIGLWEPGDTPMNEHRRWSPECPFLAAQAQAPTAARELGINEMVAGKSLPCYEIHCRVEPAFNSYRSYEARLESFREWPKGLAKTGEMLAQCGYFYTGAGDKTICAFCGVGFANWLAEDSIWERHAQVSPECDYVYAKKGQEFVNDVQLTGKSEWAQWKYLKGRNDVVDEKRGESMPVDSSSARGCIICESEDFEILFLPCAHLSCCSNCYSAFEKCPVCRKTIVGFVKVYLP